MALSQLTPTCPLDLCNGTGVTYDCKDTSEAWEVYCKCKAGKMRQAMEWPRSKPTPTRHR